MSELETVRPFRENAAAGMRNLFKYAFGAVLAAVLLWWVVKDVDPGELGRAMAGVNVPLYVASILLNVLHYVPRVWRWGLLLRPVSEHVRFRPMFVAVTLGYTITWIVPGRLGEFVRPALLSGRERLPLGPAVGSVVADRLLDGLTIVAMFTAVATSGVGGAVGDLGALRIGAWTMIAAGAVGLGTLLTVARHRERLAGWAEGAPRPVGWALRVALSTSRGVEALRHPRLLLGLVGQSLLTWGVIAVSTWLGFKACGAEVGLAGVLLMMPLLALGAAVPTPGNVGGYQAVTAFGLMSLFGIDQTIAVSTSLLMHLSITVPTILFGLVLLKLEGLVWGDLIETGRRIKSIGVEEAA
jgi:uncharacterized membrane protein YbhN (UPF0104 family)